LSRANKELRATFAALQAKDWPRGKWLAVDPFRKWALPSLPGVYVVFIEGRVAYVGQSSNIRTRFTEHNFEHGYGHDLHTPWGDFHKDTSVTMKIKLSRRLGDWTMWEVRLIATLKPYFNKVSPDRRAWESGKRQA
jgi:excinuclease UvrABC nuclease subunit